MDFLEKYVFNILEANWDAINKLAAIPQEDKCDLTKYLDVASKDGHFLVLYCLLLKRFQVLCNGGMLSVTSLTDLLKNLKPKFVDYTLIY